MRLPQAQRSPHRGPPVTATIYGAPEGFDALLLARRRAEHRGAIVHVARDDSRMARLAEALAFFAPEIEVLRFPAWDCLPYDRVSPNPELVSERIATLARLLEPPARPAHPADHRQRPGPARAAARRVPRRQHDAPRGPGRPARGDPQASSKPTATTAPAPSWSPANTPPAAASSTCSRPARRDPVRLDLFGDTIESLRRFDPSDPAQHRQARGADPAPRLRSSHRPGQHHPLPRSLARAVRPGRRQRSALPIRLRRPPLPRHRALGAAVPRGDGNPARLRTGRLGQPRPPSRGGAGSPPGDDRRPRGGPPHPAQGRRSALPTAPRRRASISTATIGT